MELIETSCEQALWARAGLSRPLAPSRASGRSQASWEVPQSSALWLLHVPDLKSRLMGCHAGHKLESLSPEFLVDCDGTSDPDLGRCSSRNTALVGRSHG
jgi:hypothetical protein